MSKVDVLRIAVDELRRTHDELTLASQRVGTKSMALSAASFALLTYLYSGETLFIPPQVYGKILYFIGLFLALAGTGMLLFAVVPRGNWEVATEVAELAKLSESDEEKYLSYVKDRYIACFINNVRLYNERVGLMKSSLVPLLPGALLLVIIKLFLGVQ